MWWESFFDADYLRLWGGTLTPARDEAEASGLWTVLGLGEGSRVLDAPCGYGRLSRLLAARGAIVLGVDQSADLLARAETDRGDVPPERLRYRQHDLRTRIDGEICDAAFNVFSSLGYGSEDDDVATLATLAAAVRPGGLVFIDTMHRDAVVARHLTDTKRGNRLADGTLLVEDPRFDPIGGRMETAWYWWGPDGSGRKPASLRLYCVTELVRLIERVGLRFRSAHKGCSPAPFELTGRLGLLCDRP